MSAEKKKGCCHSGHDQNNGHGQHKGHGWMMIICMLLMVAIPLLTLSSSGNLFNLSLLGPALLPLILCLVMHGVMMKFMMPGTKKDQGNQQHDHAESREIKKLEYKPDSSKFNA